MLSKSLTFIICILLLFVFSCEKAIPLSNLKISEQIIDTNMIMLRD